MLSILFSFVPPRQNSIRSGAEKGLLNVKGVKKRSMVDTFRLCSPFLKVGNSAFIVAIASGLFRQTEYRSLE